jgi:hypothetical protein
MNHTENKLRARIRNTFADVARADTGSMRGVEDEVLRLIKEYTSANEEKREEVYEQGQERIVRALQAPPLIAVTHRN